MKTESNVETETEVKATEAAGSLERALEEVGSEEDAARVLDELESRKAGATQADAEAAPTLPGQSAPECVQRTVEEADGIDRPVEGLAAVVEQSTGATGPGSEQLAGAVHEVLARNPTDRLKPHKYLQDAVLSRMTPLQAWDASLFISVNRFPRNSYITQLMTGVSTVALHGAGWVAGSLLLAALYGHRGRRAAAEMIPALLVTNTLVERVIKTYFRRRRPFITLVQALVVGRKPGSWSFPSGHSATSFACASALASRYKRPRPVLYFLASLVGFSRVYLGHHYPLDVVSGATIGTGLSRLVVWGLRRYRRL